MTPSAEPPSWSPGERTTANLVGEVRADENKSYVDGVYGRFAGDLALALALGAELESRQLRGLLQASAHYYWMAGLTAAYREALGKAKDELSLTRIGAVGVDLRPLFIPRWSFDWQTGPPTLDLLIDSVSLSGAAYFANAPDAERASRRGFEASVGFGVPLLGQAEGAWLAFRYVRRWPEAGPSQGSVWLTLAWHLFASTHLASSTAGMD